MKKERRKSNIRIGVAIGVIIVLSLLLFFPVKILLDDGGTVIYQSIFDVYEIRKIKAFGNIGMTPTIKEGWRIELFGKEIYYNIDREYLAGQKEWSEENFTCYFNAIITEITEDSIVLETTEDAMGTIGRNTPVAFDPAEVLAEQTVQELSVGDAVRVMYNDKRIRLENPLWLEVVFAVYPLDEDGNPR